jgi:hypothetical protein
MVFARRKFLTIRKGVLAMQAGAHSSPPHFCFSLSLSRSLSFYSFDVGD